MTAQSMEDLSHEMDTEYDSGAKEEVDDYGTSMLTFFGLLDSSEAFLPVNQTRLWQQHIAWSKTGKEVRDYRTQRFGSNMIFLPLLLNASLAVFMNSSMMSLREALESRDYWTVDYWTAIVLLMDSVFTVLALVANFIAWGLISSISDKNSHTVLRSSFGEYIMRLTSRHVIVSLYLFLLWLIMLVGRFVKGPVGYILVASFVGLFFQLVVSMSAFGRLIMYTGAMGEKRILDPDLEHQLMPSGLYACLLIKATEQKKRETQATMQYKKAFKKKKFSTTTFLSSGLKSRPKETTTDEHNGNPPYGSKTNDHKIRSDKHAQKLSPKFTYGTKVPKSSPSESLSVETWENGIDNTVREIKFPSASALNRAVQGHQLQEIVKTALKPFQQVGRLGNRNDNKAVDNLAADIVRDIEIAAEESIRSSQESEHLAPMPSKVSLKEVTVDADESRRTPRREQRNAIVYRGSVVHRKLEIFLRFQSIQPREFMEENDVREIYGYAAPRVPEPLDIQRTKQRRHGLRFASLFPLGQSSASETDPLLEELQVGGERNLYDEESGLTLPPE